MLTTTECISWGNVLRKLTSVRHKNTILRVFHGEVYTKVRLARFGLTDSDTCPRCDEAEDLEHKIAGCDYIKRIWDRVLELTSKLKVVNYPEHDRIRQILDVGCTSSTVLTIHAEILLRILSLKDASNYLVHPKALVKLALKYLHRSERDVESKREIEDLLSEC